MSSEVFKKCPECTTLMKRDIPDIGSNTNAQFYIDYPDGLAEYNDLDTLEELEKIIAGLDFRCDIDSCRGSYSMRKFKSSLEERQKVANRISEM